MESGRSHHGRCTDGAVEPDIAASTAHATVYADTREGRLPQKRWRGYMGGRPPACPSGRAKTLATYIVAISRLDCRSESDRQVWVAPGSCTAGRARAFAPSFPRRVCRDNRALLPGFARFSPLQHHDPEGR